MRAGSDAHWVSGQSSFPRDGRRPRLGRGSPALGRECPLVVVPFCEVSLVRMKFPESVEPTGKVGAVRECVTSPEREWICMGVQKEGLGCPYGWRCSGTEEGRGREDCLLPPRGLRLGESSEARSSRK